MILHIRTNISSKVTHDATTLDVMTRTNRLGIILEQLQETLYLSYLKWIEIFLKKTQQFI
jgi:hypothetical protein